MSRQIPIALQSNLDKPVQKYTHCIRIQLKNGVVTGFTPWTEVVEYDHQDGFGPIAYAAGGLDISEFEADTGYSVTNAEGRILVGTTLPGITPEMVRAGDLDDAEWVCFLVDYRNPAPGSGMILDAGDIGEVRLENGMVIIPELLSYMMRLHQAIGHVAQIPCRAIFGSPANSMTGCGVDAEALWSAGEVVSVGAESDRTFTGDIAAYFPGRLRFTSGPNAGRVYATESVDGSTITLAETVPYPVSEGDTFVHRKDCTKLKAGALGCDSYGNYLNYKGEDRIPVSDGVSGGVPGGQFPGGGGWTGEQPAVDPL